jgi:hypothetical protein
MIVEREGKQIVFAEKAGLSSAAVSRMLKKADSVNSDTLLAIVNAYPEINPTWLLTGRGNMLLTAEEQEALNKAAGSEDREKMMQRMIDLLEDRVKVLEREIKKVDPDLAREIGID